MPDTIPADRLQLTELAGRQYAAMLRFSNSIELDRGLRHLLDVRASQLNGCAFCLDMHWKDARAAGETEERLYMLPAWPESALYSEREQAALGLCEAITMVAEGQVPDEVWEQAAEHFDESELAQIVFAVTVINGWNRLMIASRTEPGHYTPGMFAE